jgi:hypothetical protein
MNFIIGHELAQAILNYLQTKPYAEVNVLIRELIKLQPLDSNGVAGQPEAEKAETK